ncbi:hypothetical protein CBA19CS22_17875 [Caballeronia novacaledonica]|uniref:Uncharacterized protein n=1 Tax=Caballeronia novacaledonica TaxID=1544861 RepID=A0ACB5QUN7_9BURK|nr:hypothetical protein CBA19CS22_17875 [Caballeronia novacaledonica]
MLNRQSADDEAIAETDTLLLTIPKQLGVDTVRTPSNRS